MNNETGVCLIPFFTLVKIFYIRGEEYHSSNSLDSLLPSISFCPGVLENST